MNPNTVVTNEVAKRTITKEIEHPVTGAKIERKANISYPEIPTLDIGAILAYFGGSTERVAKALNLALSAKLSSLYNNKLKGGDQMKGIIRVRKGLELAGLDKAAIDAMISGNASLAASVNISDINVDYTAQEIAELFDVETAADPDDAAVAVVTEAVVTTA
jgi:hypothetical protein